jgi:geranylgeranyl pyrophosphate synthase
MVKNDMSRAHDLPGPGLIIERDQTPGKELVSAVKVIISEWFIEENGFRDQRFLTQNPSTGKMLRTLLTQRLCSTDPKGFDMEAMAYSCAAVELVHAATLFHDDVIDVGEVRRGEPALWRQTSASASILIGDLFLCRAINFLSRKGSAKLIGQFIDKMHETCSAEIRQELVLRGRDLSEKDCLEVARGKTGPLFAFCAALCSKGDRRLEAALEEAGYRIGTAYQLADDLIDEKGDCDTSNKTLGTDRLRKKYTLARVNNDQTGYMKGLITSLCTSAADVLDQWPLLQSGLNTYLKHDFYPVLLTQCDF